MRATVDVLLSSSLRTTPPEVTLERAKAKAASLGVTRVTDITRLDRVGIPVYASIRPAAAEGSLCVNAGKGMRSIEAEVSAYMEAIEFALAEPGASEVRVLQKTARHVLDGRKREDAILDFCPRLGRKIDLDAPMDCVEATDIASGETALVPAELVFLPYPRESIFGASSNGLSSGNTVREATVHALCELIERDVRSFQSVKDTSVPVELPDVPLVRSVREAGLELFVRAAENEYGIPYFVALINDPESYAPHLLNGGFGCHPHRMIAFVRAVAEAAQSRLSFIHGGRDDLTSVHDRFRGWTLSRKRAFVKDVVRRASQGTPIPLDAVAEHPLGSIDDCEALLLAKLPRVYRVILCDDDLKVVRVIVPGLELFNESSTRVGKRLRDHARAS
jgi:ribosomal protein S12 methylthiotransferase accessory factor